MFARATSIALIVAAAISACQGLAVLSPRAIPANCARSYTVISGDTCDGISAKEGVSTFQLALVNRNMIDVVCDNLFPGEGICLGIVGQDCTINHIVQSGETCDSIAESAGISFGILLANNQNIDESCTNLRPGEVLCTSASVIPYTS